MTSRAEAAPQNPALAVALMVLAGALVAVTSLMAKALGLDSADAAGLHPLQVSAGRFSFAFLTLLGVVSLRPELRPSFRGAHWPTHIGRVVCGWAGVTCMFAAVARMPVADATALSFLAPPLTMLLAVVMLGESLTQRKIMAVALSLIGGGLLLRPGSDAFQVAGLLALASAGFVAVEAIFIKRLSDTEPPMRILLINNACGALISLSAASLVWQAPSGGQWGLLITLGMVMVTAQSIFIQSMRRAEASFVVPAFYSVLVFAALYDFLIYSVVPDAVAVLGAASIIGGALLLAAQRS